MSLEETIQNAVLKAGGLPLDTAQMSAVSGLLADANSRIWALEDHLKRMGQLMAEVRLELEKIKKLL